jgi:hypothetical protein
MQWGLRLKSLGEDARALARTGIDRVTCPIEHQNRANDFDSDVSPTSQTVLFLG